MQALRWLAISAALATPWTSFASESTGVNVAHFEQLQDLGFNRENAVSLQVASATNTSVLTFNALGRSYELQLEPNDRLLSGMARDAVPQGVDLYRGKIAGNEDSWVRVVMSGGEPRGLIWDGTELLAIEAPGDSHVATTAAVIFRLADMLTEPGAMSCGLMDATENGAAVYQSLLGELAVDAAEAAGATSQLNLSAIGDFQFVSSISGDPTVAIMTRLNNVDGIFSAQVGVQLVLQETEVFTTPGDDPFSSTTVPGTLANELGQYREANANHRSQGLTHLFTGRDLDGSTVGTGYISLLCWDHFGASLTQGDHGSATDSLIAAHEIGHNFGAPHDAVPGSACVSEPATFLMAPTLTTSDQFSPCSLLQMQPVIAAASCVFALPSADVTITSGNALPVLLLGDNATVTFDVRNSGADPATNVTADVTLPNNVTFLSATAPAGSCSDGAGGVNCQLGTLSGGATTTVTLSTITAAVGTDSFDAVVAADADEDPGNNQASIQVTVDPAIDLVVDIPPATSLVVGQAGTVNVSIENAASMGATDVTLTIMLDAGIRADSAGWSIGSCTTTDRRIDCQAASFAAGTNTTLSLGLTALAAGPQNYSVALTAAETDRDTSNNNVDGTVTVSTSTPGGSGGGGGASFAFLSALLWALYRRRAAGTTRRLITGCSIVPRRPPDPKSPLR